MNFDISMQVPAVFDIVHVGLAGLSLLLILILFMSGKKSVSVSDAQSAEVQAADQDLTANKSQSRESKLQDIDGEGALQLLSLLQHEGRLVDFIREELASFSDEEIGAAARVVHKGLRKTFDEHFTVEAIRPEEEGDNVSLESGYKTEEIQLLGQVTGGGPYKGTLVHQGWRVTDIRLPKVVAGKDSRILAAAQIEVGA